MAAGSTYTPIATITLGSNQTTVSFSSISGSYTDLVLIISANGTTGGATFFTFNSDTSGNYSQTRLLGDGSSASSGRRTNIANNIADAPNAGWSNIIMNLMNYSNSTTYKTSLIRSNAPANNVEAEIGMWRSTAAITSISMTMDAGQFAAGSQFTLYGIAAA